MATPNLRRTRIVCISDTHNCTVKLPAGDVLIHAGDLTNQGSYSELSRTVKWLREADFEAKIIVAGNHDITLDKDFYASYGDSFHNKNEQSPEECIALLTSSPSLTYLYHESATIRLKAPTGPQTQFTIFGSPHAPQFGQWAFYYNQPANPLDASGLTKVWESIPLDTDIVVTHTPPRKHCDKSHDDGPLGCEALRRALWRVRPKLAVCGHVHDGRGAERVVWDLENRDVPYAEKSAAEWDDPGAGNNKLSLVDLTGKKTAPALENDGSHLGRRRQPRGDESQLPSATTTTTTTTPPPLQLPSSASPIPPSQDAHPSSSVDAQGHQDGNSNIGYGGASQSENCDLEALEGRMGRRETCVINAAIMKSRFPHTGGKQFNKPIVVDLYLPVWTEEEEIVSR